jgi:sulfur transfer complex TusBCD TusB component (DsrH family)
MGVLFVISDLQDRTTVFEAAERLARSGQTIDFLFTDGACRYACDPDIIDSLGFAGGVYCLESDLDQAERENLVERVRLLDYSGWMELVETNEKIVSWA